MDRFARFTGVRSLFAVPVVLAMLLAGMALAACGGGGDTEPTARPTAAESGGATGNPPTKLRGNPPPLHRRPKPMRAGMQPNPPARESWAAPVARRPRSRSRRRMRKRHLSQRPSTSPSAPVAPILALWKWTGPWFAGDLTNWAKPHRLRGSSSTSAPATSTHAGSRRTAPWPAGEMTTMARRRRLQGSSPASAQGRAIAS